MQPRSFSRLFIACFAILSHVATSFSSTSNFRKINCVTKIKMGFLPENDEISTVDRRSLIKSFGGVALATGLVINKIKIRGPNPYQPPRGSLDGKLMIITGGNTGLGYESALRLAKGGAFVVITSRSIQKGQLAVQKIKESCEREGIANENVFFAKLDLCDLESIKAFPSILSQIPIGDKKIDVLMNNAGVMAIPDRELTKDGYEKTFQTNHLGHFALTALLYPKLNRDGATVINVASQGYLFASNGLDLDNLNGEKKYGAWSSYGLSKLENILFTKELQKRADASNVELNAFSLHPGAVRTDLIRYVVGEKTFISMQDEEARKKQPFSPLSVFLYPLTYFTKSVERGATTQVWLAAGKEGKNARGSYFIDCKPVKVAAMADDMSNAEKLWKLSEDLSGIKFDVK